MSSTASTSKTERIVWMWKSNAEADEWKRYSGIENQMIEFAYQQNEKQVELDDFWIDFTGQIQMSKTEANKQESIKRVTELSDGYVRGERFVLEQPQLTAKSFETGGGAFLPAAGFYQAKINEELVEKAAAGIEEEGAKLGRRKEAEFIANKLRKVKEKWNKKWTGRKQEKCEGIWFEERHEWDKEIREWEKEIRECCVKLYTIESFLYKLVNKVMREAEKRMILDGWFHENSTSEFESERDENYGRTLGPYCWILQKYLWTAPNEKGIVVFRSANLTNEMIDGYKKHVSDQVRWDWFSSTTKNKDIALFYDGNTIFQIHIPPDVAHTETNAVTISSLSEFSTEDEVLLSIGTVIQIKQVQYDTKVNKHVIELEVREERYDPDESEDEEN